MHRRRFLAAASIGLAGCLGESGTPDDRNASSPGNGSTTPEASEPGDTAGPGGEALSRTYWEPCTSTAAVATDVDGTGLRLAVTPPCPSGGPGRPDLYVHVDGGSDGPPLVRALLHNPSGNAETVERYPFFGSHHAPARGDGPPWYLVPTEDHAVAETAPAVERDAGGVWRLAERPGDPSSWLPDAVTVDPRSSVEGSYAVALAPGASPRPGTHVFAGAEAVAPTIYTWDRSQPGPGESSRFAGRSYPAVTRRWLRSMEGRPLDRSMAWYHDAGPGTGVYLEPSTEDVALPARVDATLVNHSDRKIRVGEGSWSLHKYTRNDWYRVAPAPFLPPAADDAALVNAGRSVERSVYLYRDAPVPVDDALEVGYLGGGAYCIDAGTATDRGHHAAVVAVDGDAVEVRPDRDVPTRWGDAEIEVGEGGDVAVVVGRAADAPFRVIPEQVMNDAVLRNTVPRLVRHHDVDRVRFLADRDALAIGSHTGTSLLDATRPVRFTFQNASYELTAERL